MKIQSYYLSKFSKLSEEARKGFVLRGNLMIVEKVEFEVKSASGIILNAVNNKHKTFGMHENAPEYYVVVQTGAGYEDGEELECSVGDVVIMPQGSVNYLSYFGSTLSSDDKTDVLALARSSDTLMVFKGKESFEKLFAELEGK